MKILNALLFAAILGLCAPAFAQAPVIDQAAPAFTATDSNGKKHALSDYAGKIVVLEWTNNDCPFVRKHYDTGNMQALQKKLTSEGVVWLSVISSAPGAQGHVTAQRANELTADRAASPTAVLLDEKGDLGRLYEAKTTPHMFVINKEGKIAYAGAIDNIASTFKEDVPRAKNYVQAAVDDLNANRPVEMPSTKPYGCGVKYDKL